MLFPRDENKQELEQNSVKGLDIDLGKKLNAECMGFFYKGQVVCPRTLISYLRSAAGLHLDILKTKQERIKRALINLKMATILYFSLLL